MLKIRLQANFKATECVGILSKFCAYSYVHFNVNCSLEYINVKWKAGYGKQIPFKMQDGNDQKLLNRESKNIISKTEYQVKTKRHVDLCAFVQKFSFLCVALSV